MTDSDDAPSLPIEIIEYIVQLAWTATTSPDQRISLFNALSSAHSRLLIIAVNIATKFVIFGISSIHHHDLTTYYNEIIPTAAALYGLPRGLNQLRAILFKRSHVHFQGYIADMLLEPFIDWLISMIGDCAHLTVVPNPK